MKFNVFFIMIFVILTIPGTVITGFYLSTNKMNYALAGSHFSNIISKTDMTFRSISYKILGNKEFHKILFTSPASTLYQTVREEVALSASIGTILGPKVYPITYN